jgi:hypothetical protein
MIAEFPNIPIDPIDAIMMIVTMKTHGSILGLT